MINRLFLYTLSLIFIFYGCEKTVIAYPGNYQSTDPVAPEGFINWMIDVDDGKGQLPENSASGLTMGILNATDDNPDDEASYEIDKQTIDGAEIVPPYFSLDSDSGITSLILINNNIDYEAISGSKEVVISIIVTDDSPSEEKGNFVIIAEITNVNEAPNFQSIESVVRYADEYVSYSSTINWTDVDDGDLPTLSFSGLPGWLTIDGNGLMSGVPQTSDIGSYSIVLTITDGGGITVQEEVNIEVRENLAPIFNNASSIPSMITVGCWDANQELIDLSWVDPNNNAQNFAGDDIVSFTVEENIEWMNWSDDGKLFCYAAPENNDAAMSTVLLSLTDDRPTVPKSTEYQIDLTVVANDAPAFSNLGSFPSQMAPGDTLNFDLDWVDPNEDQTTFNLLITIGSNTYSTSQLGWVTIDQSGSITIVPGNNNDGEKTLTFSISDGCYTVEEQKSFTIQ